MLRTSGYEGVCDARTVACIADKSIIVYRLAISMDL